MAWGHGHANALAGRGTRRQPRQSLKRPRSLPRFGSPAITTSGRHPTLPMSGCDMRRPGKSRGQSAAPLFNCCPSVSTFLTEDYPKPKYSDDAPKLDYRDN